MKETQSRLEVDGWEGLGKGGKKSFARIDWLIKVSHVSVVKVIQADMCQDSGGAVSTTRIILGWFYAMMMFLKGSELIKVLRGLRCLGKSWY